MTISPNGSTTPSNDTSDNNAMNRSRENLAVTISADWLCQLYPLRSTCEPYVAAQLSRTLSCLTYLNDALSNLRGGHARECVRLKFLLKHSIGDQTSGRNRTRRNEHPVFWPGLTSIRSLSPRTVDSLQGFRKKLRRHVRLGKPRSNFILAMWTANITAPQIIGCADKMNNNDHQEQCL